jgi:hypothetical protein
MTGKKHKDTNQMLRFALWICNADKQIEQNKTPIILDSKYELQIYEIVQLWKLEKDARNYKQYTSIRQMLGQRIGNLYNCLFENIPHKIFWQNIAITMNMIDSVSDIKKDVRLGYAPKPTIMEKLAIVTQMTKYALKTIANLGIIKSFRFLFAPAIYTIKGGFENEDKKDIKQNLGN